VKEAVRQVLHLVRQDYVADADRDQLNAERLRPAANRVGQLRRDRVLFDKEGQGRAVREDGTREVRGEEVVTVDTSLPFNAHEGAISSVRGDMHRSGLRHGPQWLWTRSVSVPSTEMPSH
jgi:hypothetical protein